jgi:serine/threonine protein kinase
MSDMIGKIILNYRIVWMIGEGGMGSVYLAEHVDSQEKVAIKILHSQFMRNEQIRIRFKSEAIALSKLSHPNIVKLIDYLEDGSGMYLIMEYVEGVTLEHYIHKITGPIIEERAVSMIISLLNAFKYAHNFVVHRDIKPSNILINKNGKLKILDFGIARIIGDENQNLTRTGTQMGTVYYMSPEQVQGIRADRRSDIYSLGLMLFEMLTGNQPLKSSTTEFQVYNRIVNEDFPPPQSIYPGIPIYFNAILKKAMAKNPNDRYQTCNDFIHAISNRNLKISNHEKKENTTYSHTFRKPSGLKKNTNSTKKISSGKLFTIVLGASFALFGIGNLIYYQPDSDRDGISNYTDKCIEEFGLPELNGCPDSDNDGVSDSEDKCTNESGSSDNNGCPYQIYCGSCGSQWNEQNISIYSKISCQNCGEELSLCKRDNGMYGITKRDVDDGTCDCTDCWDESE